MDLPDDGRYLDPRSHPASCLAQRIAYTLRVAGGIELSGKRGGALEYCRSRCVPVTHPA
jgi:hypothetical protein